MADTEDVLARAKEMLLLDAPFVGFELSGPVVVLLLPVQDSSNSIYGRDDRIGTHDDRCPFDGGPRQPMTAAELLRAAEVLEREAEWLRAYQCADSSKDDYDEMLSLAAKLREEAKKRPRW